MRAFKIHPISPIFCQHHHFHNNNISIPILIIKTECKKSSWRWTAAARVTQVDQNCSNQRNLHHLDDNLISCYHQHYFCHPHPHHQDSMQEEQWMEVDYCCESDRVSVGDLPPCLTLPLRQLTNVMIWIFWPPKIEYQYLW